MGMLMTVWGSGGGGGCRIRRGRGVTVSFVRNGLHLTCTSTLIKWGKNKSFVKAPMTV